MRYKHGSLDKWDCHFPGTKPFMQDNWAISHKHESLHLSAGYMHYDTDRRSHRFGVNRKAHKVSRAGIMVDHHYIGKPEVI